MKKTLKNLTVLAMLTGVGILVIRKISKNRKLNKVAETGYETAHDVLYTGREVKSRKLRYGPVLPE
jgi:hypothetical protein